MRLRNEKINFELISSIKEDTRMQTMDDPLNSVSHSLMASKNHFYSQVDQSGGINPGSLRKAPMINQLSSENTATHFDLNALAKTPDPGLLADSKNPGHLPKLAVGSSSQMNKTAVNFGASNFDLNKKPESALKTPILRDAMNMEENPISELSGSDY